MKKYFPFIILILLSCKAKAQQETMNWYFGETAGISFLSGSPVATVNGSLSTMEGCSSISDFNGDLLFYTDGMSVWNNDNIKMPNGHDLLGDPSSTQSGIIIPKPYSDTYYYIFTIDDVANGPGGANGFNYSLVDISLDNGKGDIVDTVKNINLTSPACEKIAAVKHANGIDIWVIIQKWETNNIYAYLVTDEGVADTPVISEVGQFIMGEIDNAKGYMKVSPNGEVMAKANVGLRNVEIFDFNNATGEVSNGRILPITNGEPYGIEFSPDSKILYVNTWKHKPAKELFQYDLEAGAIDDIIASEYIVGEGTEGALQIAPDGKIYVAMNGYTMLARINQPNYLGVDCNYEFADVSLGNRICRWGLPNFISSVFLGVGKQKINSINSVLFIIYPNPNNGIFNIQIKENLLNPTICLYNDNGSVVYQKEYQKQFKSNEIINLDISNLKTGNYIIELSTNKSKYSERLIIE